MYLQKIAAAKKIPEIVAEIQRQLSQSRFVADVTASSRWIKIVNVRLLNKKIVPERIYAATDPLALSTAEQWLHQEIWSRSLAQ